MRDVAINNLYSNVHNQVNDKCYDVNGNSVEVDESKITIEIDRLQAANDVRAYARNRAPEYPSYGDQMDMIYKDNLNSTTTHKDAVEAVKTKWPKNNTGPVE
jgi:hypothetical protein